MCAPFVGGFVSGFVYQPWKAYTGFKRMRSQGGVILAKAGVREEEENRWIDAQLRLVYGVLRDYDAPGYQRVRDAWQAVPPELRVRLRDEGFHAAGSFAGGLAANQLLLLGAGWLGGRMIARTPRLRPLLAVGRPAGIGAGALLAALVFQGTVTQLLLRQRQLFAQYPGSEQMLKDTVEQANKGWPKK
jgi:hypothetical protein